MYVAAFGRDEGESIGKLLAQGPPTPALAHLDVDGLGFAWLPEADFVGHFASDVDRARARVMYATQQPFAGRMGATTVEVDSSHVPMVSRPGDVVALLDTATAGVS